MAKTQGELVREHDNAIATILERLAGSRADMNRLEALLIENTKAIYRLETQLGRLDERVGESRKTREEHDRKRWTLVVAVVGSILALIANILLTIIRK